MKLFLMICFLILVSVNIAIASNYSDLNINDEVSIKENAIVFFIDKTNCISCEIGLKELLEYSNKSKLAQYLVVSGGSYKATMDYAKQKELQVTILDDTDFKYSKEFKLKSTPTYFVVNFLGKVQNIGKIGSGDYNEHSLTPSRKRLPKLDTSFDYFFTMQLDSSIITYNASNNTLLKLNISGETISSYKIEGGMEVVRNMFRSGNSIICVIYSPISGTKLSFLDTNLISTQQIKLKIDDPQYLKYYTLDMESFIDNSGHFYSAVNKFSDSIQNPKDVIVFDINTGNEIKYYFSNDTILSPNMLVLLKNEDHKIIYFKDKCPKSVYIMNDTNGAVFNIKIGFNEFENENNYIRSCFAVGDRIYWIYGNITEGYGSLINRVKYNILITDDKFNLIGNCNLSNVYNNSAFVFWDLIAGKKVNMLGRDEMGCFLETFDL